jgi:hypothetical protein
VVDGTLFVLKSCKDMVSVVVDTFVCHESLVDGETSFFMYIEPVWGDPICSKVTAFCSGVSDGGPSFGYRSCCKS